MLPTSRPFLRLKPRLSNIFLKPGFRRHLTTPPPPQSSQQSRADRILSKLPKSLHPYAKPYLTSPPTTITSFLILHELTAVIPLFAFFAVFQLTSWNPADLLPSEWVDSGYRKFKGYVEKKGWEWIDARMVMDLGIAWAVVKALLPVRVLGSLWIAPWFAGRVLRPVLGFFRR
ncbi:hypothetical protein TWF481_011293 [Arthrobotrys musiformis]|uniref:Uncharacterized protein n=1 Tax=Arthrobotrys musiformis TaxID=47236 RepID=A0AAV9VZT6_9PEZI